MIKKSLWIGLLLVIGMSPGGFAESKASAPLSEKQRIVNRQTPINTVTDFFATLGTSGPRKAQILKERKETRRIERLLDLQRRKSPEVRQYEKRRRAINRELQRHAENE